MYEEQHQSCVHYQIVDGCIDGSHLSYLGKYCMGECFTHELLIKVYTVATMFHDPSYLSDKDCMACCALSLF